MENPPASLGFLEVGFLSIAAVVADRMVQQSPVHLLGFESTGNERLLIRIAGPVAAVVAALDCGIATAQQLGGNAVVSSIPAPAAGMEKLSGPPNSTNPLYGGRDQFLPEDYPTPKNKIMEKSKQQALGILETQGLTAALEAADAMLKAANVQLVGKEKIGAAYVSIMVSGDVAAVTAAIDAGSRAVGNLGKLIAGHVIARPHDDLAALLPK